MKFSLAWLLLSLAVLGLCLGSSIALGNHELCGVFISIFLFLSLSLRTADETIQAESRPAKICLNFFISFTTITLAMVALEMGRHIHHQMTARKVINIISPEEMAMIALAVFGALHFLALLPVAVVVWMVGRAQQRRSAVTGLAEPPGE